MPSLRGSATRLLGVIMARRKPTVLPTLEDIHPFETEAHNTMVDLTNKVLDYVDLWWVTSDKELEGAFKEAVAATNELIGAIFDAAHEERLSQEEGGRPEREE